MVSPLTPTQDRFLKAFFADMTTDEPFYLSGGTALAGFYLRHRYSDDLDFFTRSPGALELAERRVRRTVEAAGLEIDREDAGQEFRRYHLIGDPTRDHPLTKLEVIWDPPPYPASPRRFGPILVDDILCITVNKVTIVTRDEVKDYVDLYFSLLEGQYRLEDLIPLAKEKLPGLDEWTIAGKFIRAKRLTGLAEFQKGYLIKPIDWDELIRFYANEADRLFALFPPRAQE